MAQLEWSQIIEESSNKNTKPFNYLIFNFDIMLQNLNEAHLFLKLDLTLRYLQMLLEENSKEKICVYY